MNNNLIQIEKGKYTTLLRRVLGMRMSENGVSEMEAILTTISSVADSTRRAYGYGASKQEIEDNIETIGLAIDYFNISKDDAYPTTHQVHENVGEPECEDCL